MRAPEPDDRPETEAEAREQDPPDQRDQRDQPVRRTGPVIVLR